MQFPEKHPSNSQLRGKQPRLKRFTSTKLLPNAAPFLSKNILLGSINPASFYLQPQHWH
jgi:hypothetical protein